MLRRIPADVVRPILTARRGIARCAGSEQFCVLAEYVLACHSRMLVSGIQFFALLFVLLTTDKLSSMPYDEITEWIPACAGMTDKGFKMTDEIATGAAHPRNNKEFLMDCMWKWIPDIGIDTKEGRLRAVLDERLRIEVAASDSSLARNRCE